ncbi:MAG: MinD/ParA family protein [Leptospiraceae bacterium]|nr:MinD/ParA family protein [Leptospiraceae bacterium]
MDQASGLRKLKEEFPISRGSSLSTKRTNAIIFAIASGKGGVGKTTFAVNFAINLAREGKRVLVLDGDLGLANINVVLGIIPKFTLYHVIRGTKTLRDIILQTPEGIDIIPGANGYSQLADLDPMARDLLIRNFSELENYDYIIIDTGAGINTNVISLILAADEAIVVTTPEPTSITDSYGLIKSITQRNRGFKLNVVINKARDDIEGRKVARRVIEISYKFLSIRPKELGIIYKDEEVEKSILSQKPFMVNAPRSRASDCLNKITKNILSSENENKDQGSNKLGGYIRKFFQFSDIDKVKR